MNDLVISLIGLGIIAMIGVIAYNKWQEHQARKSMERSFPADFQDALMTQTPAKEAGTASAAKAAGGAASSAPFERREPSFAQAVAAQEQAAIVESSQTSYVALTPENAAEQVLASLLPTASTLPASPAVPVRPARTEPQLAAPASAAAATHANTLSASPDVVSQHATRLLTELSELAESGNGEPLRVEQQALEAVASHAAAHHAVVNHTAMEPQHTPAMYPGVRNRTGELPESTPMASPDSQPEARAEHTAKQLSVDELIDCVIPMELTQPVPGNSALAQFAYLDQVGGKPVRYIGQDQDGHWGELQPRMSYHMLVAGIQLANRNSSLSQHDFTEAVNRLSQSAAALGAAPAVPDMADIVGTASSLHTFILDHDVTLGVNIRASGAAWGLSTLLSALTRQGFDRKADGSLMMPDGDNGALFSLSTNVNAGAAATSLLTLGLRIPLVAAERRAYYALVSCAKALAIRLGGTIVDDSGQPLSDSQLKQIGTQVDVFYQNMASSGIDAGSHRARRLFA